MCQHIYLAGHTIHVVGHTHIYIYIDIVGHARGEQTIKCSSCLVGSQCFTIKLSMMSHVYIAISLYAVEAIRTSVPNMFDEHVTLIMRPSFLASRMLLAQRIEINIRLDALCCTNTYDVFFIQNPELLAEK